MSLHWFDNAPNAYIVFMVLMFILILLCMFDIFIRLGDAIDNIDKLKKQVFPSIKEKDKDE